MDSADLRGDKELCSETLRVRDAPYLALFRSRLALCGLTAASLYPNTRLTICPGREQAVLSGLEREH